MEDFDTEQISATRYTIKEQILKSSLGGSIDNALQEVDFQYLPNRFLTKINDVANMGNDHFAMNLNYDAQTTGTENNGNISSLEWSTSEVQNQQYEFTYDYLNRLGNAAYTGLEVDRYTTTYTYDVRGNMMTLTRNGFDGQTMGEIDNLDFTIPENKNIIQSINETSSYPSHKSSGFKAFSNTDFTYDPDGNMTYDPGKKAEIEYSHLNLPNTIEVADSNAIIKYFYSADGVLHKKEELRDEETYSERLYVGQFEYTNGVVEQIHLPTGFVELTNNVPDDLSLTGTDVYTETYSATRISSDRNVLSNLDVTYKGQEHVRMTAGFKTEDNTHFLATIEAVPPMSVRYNYVLKDHLGNTRIVFSDANNDGAVSNDEVLSEHHYYPFGMEMNGEWNINRPQYNYTYNGKENQRELGLGYLNYGARFYDASIGRWSSIDPAAEMYYPYSIYGYTANNPIRYSDPNGMWITDADGNPVTWSEEEGWSDNATDDIKKIGNAMLEFEQGKADLLEMMDSETKIHLEVKSKKSIILQDGKAQDIVGETQPHDENGNPLTILADPEGKYGSTIFSGTPAYMENEDGSSSYKEVTITIYEENIEKITSKKEQSPVFGNKTLTLDQGVAVTAGHEKYHAINTGNITNNKKRLEGKIIYNVEAPAYIHEKKYLDQIK